MWTQAKTKSQSKSQAQAQAQPQGTSRKSFCKVCHDAGKTEQEYTSHFVRASPAPNAPVVCPTLLAQECRYCFEPGHTVSCCPGLAEKKMNEERFERSRAKDQRTREFNDGRENISSSKVQAIRGAVVKANAFAALNLSDDSENEEPVKRSKPKAKKMEEFPTLSTSASASASVKAETPKLLSWAAKVAAAPIAPVAAAPVAQAAPAAPAPTIVEAKKAALAEGFISLSAPRQQQKLQPEMQRPQPQRSFFGTKAGLKNGTSWADASDDEEDEDEEKEVAKPRQYACCAADNSHW
jgi:hypothetical protein